MSDRRETALTAARILLVLGFFLLISGVWGLAGWYWAALVMDPLQRNLDPRTPEFGVAP